MHGKDAFHRTFAIKKSQLCTSSKKTSGMEKKTIQLKEKWHGAKTASDETQNGKDLTVEPLRNDLSDELKRQHAKRKTDCKRARLSEENTVKGARKPWGC